MLHDEKRIREEAERWAKAALADREVMRAVARFRECSPAELINQRDAWAEAALRDAGVRLALARLGWLETNPVVERELGPLEWTEADRAELAWLRIKAD